MIVLFSGGIFLSGLKSKMGKPGVGGQSIIEYIIIFALVAALSVTVLLPKIQGIFGSYVQKATGAMQ